MLGYRWQGLLVAVILGSESSGRAAPLLYVNGGHSPTENFEKHEIDMHSWLQMLGEGRSRIVLNAGGTKTEFQPLDETGSNRLNADGSPQIAISTFAERNPTLDIRKADKAEIPKALAELATTSPGESLTMIVGDHGGPKGISLWNADPLTANELNGFYKKFPTQNTPSKETFVRTLHLQCMAWGHVVDLAKPHPQTRADLDAYLAAQFPPERCSLALSLDDEKSRYYAVKAYPNNFWGHMSRDRIKGGMTLASVQEYLVKSDFSYPTPSLTSDFFISTIANFHRRVAHVVEGVSPPGGQHGTPVLNDNSSLPTPRDSMSGEFEAVNRSALATELNALHSRVLEINAVINSFQSLYVPLMYEYAAQFDGEFYDRVIKPNSGKASPDPEFLSYLEKTLKNSDFLAFVRKRLAAGTTNLVNLAPLEKFLKAKSLPPEAAVGIEAVVENDLYKIQLERKQKMALLRDRRRAVVKKWLDRPENAPLRTQYEKLMRCEASVL